jgi:hypothetical protein
MMQHASKAHLWTKCALSGSLIAGRADGYVSPHDPDADKDKSDARREGKAAAWLIGEMISDRLTRDVSPVGITAPNGWVIDAEMTEHCRNYVTYVQGHIHTGTLLTEHSISIGDEITGRCDTAIIDHARAEVHVFDFKYGWRLVEVAQNPELLCYGCAMMPHGYNLVLHIYQPRPFHPDGIARMWAIGHHMALIRRNDLRLAAARAGAPGCEGTPGEHCRDCPGRGSCQALAATTYAAFEVVRDSRLAKMDAKQLSAELEFLELAEACIKERKAGIVAEAEGRIAGGEFVAGWELQPKTGNRVFTVDAAKVHMMTGIHPFKQVQVSPAELERMGASKTVVKTITTSPPIGRKLARTSVEALKRAFGKQGK